MTSRVPVHIEEETGCGEASSRVRDRRRWSTDVAWIQVHVGRNSLAIVHGCE